MINIHNFLLHSRLVEEAFLRVETNDNAVKVELHNTEDEIHVEINVPELK